MERTVFTEGNQPGGLGCEHEIRILICYVLGSIGVPMTFTQLNHAFQSEGIVNYFELAQSVSRLLHSGHLVESASGAEEKKLMLTDLGAKTAVTFEKSIPLSIREKALKATRDNLLRQRIECENQVRIQKTSDGYQMTLTIPDVGTDLMSLSLFVPTLALCNKIKAQFLADPTICYRGVIEILTGERLPDAKITDVLG